MADDRLIEALGDLPEQKASEGFTHQVLRRVDQPARPARGATALVAAAAVIVPAVLIGAGWLWLRGAPSPASPDPVASSAGNAGALAVPAEPVPRSAPAATADDLGGQDRDPVLLKLQELRAAHRRLQDDWRELRRLEAENAPVLYLGGNERVDLVLDLRRVPPDAVLVGAQPAAFKQRSPSP